MREAKAIRARAAEVLLAMLHSPSMWGTGQSVEFTIRSQLSDLAFIDGREDDLSQIFQELEDEGLWGALGAWGILCELLGPGAHSEVLAALYARAAMRLGYFEPQRKLTEEEWLDLQRAPEWATGDRRSRADVERRFGEPSYRGTSQQPLALGYVRATDSAWLTFHFDRSPSSELQWLHLPTTPFQDAVFDLRDESEVSSEPEDAYRTFLIASLAGNEAEIRKHLLVHAAPSILWAGAYPVDVARLLAEQYTSMNVFRVPAPDDVVYLVSDAVPLPLPVVKVGSEWRVDAEALVRMRSTAF
ncbi:MAG: hypothetical protein ACOY0T_21350 [Myxococcota bacterium]